MNVVLKIGGHLFSREQINHALIREYVGIIKEVFKPDWKMAVVVGGGSIARSYIDAARTLGIDEGGCDEIAVAITRANARLLAYALGEQAHKIIPESSQEVRALAGLGKVVVMGGLQPGQSTFAVAAIAAEALNAERLIVASDVNGVYTADPKKNRDARLLEETTIKDLEGMIMELPQTAGKYPLIDSLGLKILARSRIPCILLNGENPVNIRKSLSGQKVGTLIKPT